MSLLAFFAACDVLPVLDQSRRERARGGGETSFNASGTGEKSFPVLILFPFFWGISSGDLWPGKFLFNHIYYRLNFIGFDRGGRLFRGRKTPKMKCVLVRFSRHHPAPFGPRRTAPAWMIDERGTPLRFHLHTLMLVKFIFCNICVNRGNVRLAINDRSDTAKDNEKETDKFVWRKQVNLRALSIPFVDGKLYRIGIGNGTVWNGQ